MSKHEHYKTTVRYYNCRTRRNQKYITIELPADSVFKADDRVEISIAESDHNFQTTCSADDRITAGAIIRQMDVGDCATFSIEQWTNVRTIASQIKEMYGSVFRVRKDRHRPENIIVKRLS